ncbi:pentapeptide repeat-containing protein [Roseofilum capinflatum]|uniref:Pentapeptide repeat-containing protein n=1 Tax=Roseofilum capinflatum BLCC-M114 TaxID=3022440 RepID=A0ABT7B5X2_9CYAN|nr:pentapeptide repeat-containing protein [Roseofilum capinflatum]MDJ1174515.1 pentapeptide repeat-containing protein [Roseofilum capinflatum BLCC-M114]
MADEMAQYHSQVDGEIKGLSIGTGNVIYNYFYSPPKASTNEDVTETDSLRCPYRGLFHFSPKDAEYFFGRDDFIEDLYQATQTRNFIPVLGASGSGKSSVVFAGLVPKLQAEGSWQFTYFRPGVIRKQDKQEIADPFYALATALVPLYTPDLNKTEQLAQGNTLAGLLRSGEVLLSDVIATIQDNYPGDRLLLIADQFEELYTVCTDAKVRHRFLDILIDNIYTPSSDSPLVLVLTMRADFLGNALSYASFAQVLKDDMKLGAMNHTELRDVIEKPAQKLGVTFELGLVETILDDVEDEPGNLPLLEFALTELWKRRKGQKITHQAYQEIGKVQGALTRHADRILSKLSPEETKAAQRIFLKLVNPGEGMGDTRRQVTQAEIGVSNWNFVNKLADYRLVVTSQNTNDQETVEVVHEALIRNWSQLREWIDESREAIRTAQKIEAEAKEWEKKGRNNGYLLQDRRLRDAKEFMQYDHPEVKLSGLAKDFIKASQRKQRMGSLRIGSILIIPAFIVLLPLHFWLVNQAFSLLYRDEECQPNAATKFFLQYIVLTGYKKQLRGAELCNENLRNSFLYESNLSQANFESADLSHSNLQDTELEKAEFERAKLIGVNLNGSFLLNANFQGAILEESTIQKSYLKGANFNQANLIEVNLEKSLMLTPHQLNKAILCNTILPKYIDIDDVNPNKDC